MSEMIVQVRNKILRRIGGVNHFVSHNKDYTIQFQFDESWNNVRTKMAVFAYEDGEYGSEIFDGDTCNVPEFPREGRILIGVKAGEDLSTELLCIPVCKSADDVITDKYDEPDPKIYEQILDIINNLWNGGTTVYPSPVKFLASPSAAKVGDLIRVKEVDENGDVTRTEGFDVGVELEKKINAPQVAQVGEVLTVEEVGEDGKPKKWKTQVVDVDGVLKYTEQELTTEEQAQARKNIGAQQTDFIINVKENEDGVVAADKTLVEIKTAYESKVNMWAVFYGNRYIFQGYLRITDSYLFVCVMDNVVTKYGSISMIEFNSNGNISIHGMEFTALYKMEQIIVGNGGAISGVPLGQNPVPENATYVTVPKASGLKAGKVLTTTGENGVLAMEWKDINFPVIITSTTTDGVTTYTADKTFAEIKAAYENGANVYAEDVPYAGNAIPLTFCSGSANIVFSGITDINRVYCITINKNNNISVVSGRTGAPLYSWSELPLVMQNPPFVISVSDDKAPDGGGLLYYTYGKNDRIIEYDMITRTGNYYKVFTDRQNNEITLSLRGQFVPAVTTSDNGKILQVANGTWAKTDLPASLPSPTTAQVGQIVKVKAVDADGKITETEAVDMSTIVSVTYDEETGNLQIGG